MNERVDKELKENATASYWTVGYQTSDEFMTAYNHLISLREYEIISTFEKLVMWRPASIDDVKLLENIERVLQSQTHFILNSTRMTEYMQQQLNARGYWISLRLNETTCIPENVIRKMQY